MKKNELKNLVVAAMLLAVGLVLPFLTGQIQQIGNMLLPMHFPVILCGLICGWKYGLGVGFILPLLRSAIFGMPVMYPNAFAMAFELAAYGFFVGFLFSHAKWQCIKSLYRCLIMSMLLGRAVWGVVMTMILTDRPYAEGRQEGRYPGGASVQTVLCEIHAGGDAGDRRTDFGPR